MTKDEVKKLIRECIAEGIDLDIPDDEIARVVTAETAGLVRRVEALEKAPVPMIQAESVTITPPTSKAAPKPGRVDVLRARHNAKKAAKEALAA